ncbi:hypothetical protein G2W53_033617 [Senna tora]|uniref:Uncharacterized protein n=1 Tax=Senna tora TaxID=362788 RepID=A0A834T1K8_9FABA|nr:hypothetical protein G2W53_033617 [Senna tora]
MSTRDRSMLLLGLRWPHMSISHRLRKFEAINTAKAFGKDVFINQEQKLGTQR